MCCPGVLRAGKIAEDDYVIWHYVDNLGSVQRKQNIIAGQFIFHIRRI